MSILIFCRRHISTRLYIIYKSLFIHVHACILFRVLPYLCCSVLQCVAVCCSVLQLFRVFPYLCQHIDIISSIVLWDKTFGCTPSEKLLGDGFSTPIPLFCLICTIVSPLFCLICTIVSNKTCILD